MKPLLAVVILAVAFGFSAQAQQAQKGAEKPAAKPAAEEDAQARFTSDAAWVNLLFTVTDKKGRFITNLTRDDFEVSEEKRRQKILEFTAETDLPLRLAILIDTSNSIRTRFNFIQEAAIEFINSVMRPKADRALVVSFDSSAQFVADLEDDTEKLDNLIRDLRPGGPTSLYDAIYFACRDKLSQDQPRHKFRRAMVILSDGDDNQSQVSRDQALEMAQKADVVIYTISTNTTRIETDGDKVLKYLSSETGGQSFFPFKVEDLSQSFENIANELRHQYTLAYRPDPLKTDGSYQTVNVKVRDRRDVVVRARKGYYATAPKQ